LRDLHYFGPALRFTNLSSLCSSVRIAGTIIGGVVADSGIAEVTDAAQAQRLIWVRYAITAPCPAGFPEIRASATSRQNRGLVKSGMPAKSASTNTEVTTSEAALADSV